MEKNISFKPEKYIRLELSQQSLLTSHVIAPSVVSRVKSKWMNSNEWIHSNEWIFGQFRTFDTWKVYKWYRPCACFCSVAVITCAIRVQGPQFDPGQKHAFGVLFTENEKSKIPQGTELVFHYASFCSIVQCSAVQSSAVQCSAVQCCAV
jgi:hypothetical protein